MSISVLFRNVRGNHEKMAVVKEVVNKSKADVILLQETKLKSPDKANLRQICCFNMVDGVCLPSRGASRRI